MSPSSKLTNSAGRLPELHKHNLKRLFDTSKYKYTCEIVYECQRGFMVMGSLKFNAGLLSAIDPSPWCDKTMTSARSDIQTYQLPNPSWQWVSPHWIIDFAGDVDENGWEYAGWFGSKVRWYGRPQPMRSFVRRRRWLRLRRCPQSLISKDTNVREPNSCTNMKIGKEEKATAGQEGTISINIPINIPINNINVKAIQSTPTEEFTVSSPPHDTVVNPKLKPHRLRRALTFCESGVSNDKVTTTPSEADNVIYPLKHKQSHLKRLTHRIHQASSSVSKSFYVHASESHGNPIRPHRRVSTTAELPSLYHDGSSSSGRSCELENIPFPLSAGSPSKDQTLELSVDGSSTDAPAQYHSDPIISCTPRTQDNEKEKEGEDSDDHHQDLQSLDKTNLATNDSVDVELIRMITAALIDIIYASSLDRERLAFVRDALSEGGYTTLAVWHGIRDIYSNCILYGTSRIQFIHLILCSAAKLSPQWVELCAKLALNSMGDMVGIHNDVPTDIHKTRRATLPPHRIIGKVSMPVVGVGLSDATPLTPPPSASMAPTNVSYRTPTHKTDKALPSPKALKSSNPQYKHLPPLDQPHSISLCPSTPAICEWNVKRVWTAILKPLVEQDSNVFFSDLKPIIPH